MKELKGKDTFTSNEIKELKELIKLRNKVSASEQKGIRQKMRDIGFYGRDDWGITNLKINDLDILIAENKIKISDKDITITISERTRLKDKVPKKQPQKHNTELKYNLVDLESLLEKFKCNCFDPKIDLEAKIPDSPGNYILCLRKNSKLPKITTPITLTKFEGLDVIYTGIAGSSLRKRDYKQHFIGNNAGRSTLRKSIGVLFGYRLIPRDKNPNTGKTKFKLEDEIELSKWMHLNLVLYFLPNKDFNKIETKLINYFNPALNLKDNSNKINADFRFILSELRNKRNI